MNSPISFSGITFKKSVIFSHLELTNIFCITDCTFHDIEFLSSPIKDLKLINNKFLGKFKISHRDSRKGVEKIKIEELTFMSNTIATETLVRFGYLDVNIFRFRNIHNPINSEINIGECDFNNFYIYNLRNQGKFKIYRINTEKTQSQCEEFKLADSSFANSEFQNVNLACYKKVCIQDSLFSDLKYTGVHWPNDLETDPTDAIKKKQDIYRILKNVAQQNNDAPQAIVFYAKEMKAYSHTLSWKKGEIIDKCILLFNHKTNNFGLNWVWPIRWILGLGFLLYILLLLSCSGICNPDVAGKFFVFLNPTHKIEFVCKESWGFFTYFFDFVFRLIETTLIYQTIVAFRKFTRKL